MCSNVFVHCSNVFKSVQMCLKFVLAHCGGAAQWFIRWVDAEVDLFWESGQNFLFNLSKHNEFYTMSMSISYNDSDNNRYARDMPKICPRYAQDMPELCTRYA